MSIEDFIKTANKSYGGIVRLKDKPSWVYGENVIPTGSLALDAAIGIGGIPKGLITEIVGNPASGKTSLALHLIANAQKMGMNTLYVDAEYALDVFYADNIGVDTSEMFLYQPMSGEKAMNLVEEAVRSGSIGLIVIDSVAALVPTRELEGEIGDSHVGLIPRLMAQSIRKMTGPIKLNNVAVVFINQFRANIATTGYGGPTRKATGGIALEYGASLIIEVARIATNKQGEVAKSNRTQAKITKNKVGIPYRVAEFDIVYGVGIDRNADLVDVAESFGIVKRNGAWYTYGEEKIQGKQGIARYLDENPAVRSEIESRVSSEIARGHSVRLGVSDQGSNDSERQDSDD